MQPDGPEPGTTELNPDADGPASSSSSDMRGASQQPGKSSHAAADLSQEQSEREPARPDSATAVTFQLPVNSQREHHPSGIHFAKLWHISQDDIPSQNAQHCACGCIKMPFWKGCHSSALQHVLCVVCIPMPEHLLQQETADKHFSECLRWNPKF